VLKVLELLAVRVVAVGTQEGHNQVELEILLPHQALLILMLCKVLLVEIIHHRVHMQ
jgi:hypothetical protein